MFLEFRQTLLKMGKFRLEFGIRLKDGWGIFIYFFIYAIVYLVLYSFLAVLWIIYGVICLMALPVKFVKGKVDRGEWEKAKVLKVCGITFAVILVIRSIGTLASEMSKGKNVTTSSAVSETVVATTAITSSEITVVDPMPVVYEYDEIVNNFIVNYNEIAAYPLKDISHNKRLDYCTAYSNDLEIQLVGRDTIFRRIDIKIFTSNQEKILEILPDILSACNISKDVQNSIIDEIKSTQISLDKNYDNDNVSIFYTKSSSAYLEIIRYLK